MNLPWDTIELGIAAGVGFGSVYAMLALSYNMMIGSSGVFNLAQGAIITVGVVGSYVLRHILGVPIPIDIFILAAAGGTLGLLAERVAVRPFFGIGTHLAAETLVSTLGLGLALTAILSLLFGPNNYSIEEYVSSTPLMVGSLLIRPIFLVMLAAAIVVTVAMELFLRFTSAGIITRATIFDREGAGLMGISVERVIQLSFGVGGVLGAVSGFLIAPLISVSVFSGDSVALFAFAALTIGGFGSFRGSILGGMLVGLLAALTPVFLNSYWVRPVIYAALILILIAKPSGFLGQAGGFGGSAVRDV